MKESNPEPVPAAWSPIKVIGAVLAFGGVALAIYFDNFLLVLRTRTQA